MNLPGLPSEHPMNVAWRKLLRNRSAMAGLWFFAFIVAAAVLGPWLSETFRGLGPNTFTDRPLEPPCWRFPFGTDTHGRDLLARVLQGARISLLVGLVGTVVSLTVGVLYGMVAGYCGGKVDAAMMRVVDVLYSLPRLIFVITLIAALDATTVRLLDAMNLGAWSGYSRLIVLFVGLGVVEWLAMARIVRGQVLALKERQFVTASRALGASTARILFQHLLPNLTGLIITYLTLTVPVVILEESFLSFLGLGIQAPLASWGSLISEGAQAINPLRIFWWLLVFPAAVMVATLLALNFLGDGLREAFDPRSLKGN